MNILGNTQMRGKLFLGLFSLLAIMAVVMVLSYVSTSRMRELRESLNGDKFFIALALKNIRTHQNGIRENVLEAVLTDNPAVRDNRIQAAAQRTAEIDKDLQAVVQRLKDNPDIFPKLKAFIEVRNAFVEERQRLVLPLILAGKKKEVQKISLGIQSERNQTMQVMADDLIEAVENHIAKNLAQSQRWFTQVLFLFIILGLIALTGTLHEQDRR